LVFAPHRLNTITNPNSNPKPNPISYSNPNSNPVAHLNPNPTSGSVHELGCKNRGEPLLLL